MKTAANFFSIPIIFCSQNLLQRLIVMDYISPLCSNTFTGEQIGSHQKVVSLCKHDRKHGGVLIHLIAPEINLVEGPLTVVMLICL